MIPIGFLEIGITDLIEIGIIALVLSFLYRWIRGTFAIQAALGLVFVILINAGVSLLGLSTLNFILRSVLDVGVLAVIIIFQPEIRKLLYSLGQNTSIDRFFSQGNTHSVIDEVITAVRNMAQTKTGALIVFSRSSSLQDLVDVGINLDARVKSELLETLFKKDSPLHDGAVIIRDSRIVAASCYLPISQNPNLSSVFGTRHRAAVGISETNNVFVIVVSEETGRISVARNGSLTSGLSIQRLRAELESIFGGRELEQEESGFSSEKSGLELK